MSAVSPGRSVPAESAGLADWLAYLEALHARPIELGLDRVRAVADRLGLSLDCVKIVVGGTNGKGSTCAMLEAILLSAGYRVGTYTSPHLIDFNERARVNGESASDAALVAQLRAVEAARGATSLTYFEFTTLAILRLFSQSSLDAVVLEVGLGGRLDAVNIVDADCAIVTSVDIDHVEFLGGNREDIGWEKAHIYRPGRPAICADPEPPARLLAYAEAIGADLWLFSRDFNYAGDRQQWNYGGRSRRRNALAYPALRGANQLLNAAGALAVLEALEARLPVPQQAVRQGLANATLPGRFQIVPGQPTQILDVAHNPHAAAVLAQNLDNMGFFPYTYAVFGMLADKDVDAVIAHLAGRIDHWVCVDLPGPRAMPAAELARRVAQAGIGSRADTSVAVAAEPAAGLAAARERAGEGDRIVVFGSFLTVAGVLSHGVLYAQPRG
ncbi:bifunctional tetrahydrofolate synthase/dihydrofolate synthase [Verticiella sediminum]|uniref:Dihydrofolate synthase/folylpolyglutamate synthase n=1 Tax=Verticiella sediminum TaxID=1247510 RepID=A0A556AY87_9BURK|nr:bifunctional tetrahydrofolate synthase/dihydrofolate synthase [Verticiella sediminum]TSH97856.1 bifunctional tetrahydrofolate synthase/dihydrofolate synthase [Verticiella sediminum]